MPRITMERSGEMEVFERVIHDGGFSAAARSLGLTPSAVSKLIARLEARLGVRLFVRTTRALTLTEEGQTYHRAALRILQELTDAEQSVVGKVVRGPLRVNASLPFGSMYIVPVIPAFTAKYPEVNVDISLTDEVVNLVDARADVAIRMGTLPDSALIARKLGQSRRVVCASPQYLERMGVPKTPADLASHECIRFNFRRPDSGWPFRKNKREILQPISGRVTVNNGETMRQLALASGGIARLGRFHVERDLRDGTLVPLLERFNPGDIELIHAVYVGGGHLPQRVRAFIDYLVDALAESPLSHGRTRTPRLTSNTW